MDAEEAAWVGGLFEGEGCITISSPRARHPTWSVQLEVKMTDQDTIRRLHAIAGCGGVTAGKDSRPNHSPTWRWRVAEAWEVRRILRAIRPWLGRRRGAKADEAVAWIEQMSWIA